MVQILHCGSYKHWVTISTLGCAEGIVEVYDSVDNSTVNEDTLEQICSIINTNTNTVTLRFKTYQMQIKETCGIMAAASALALASGQDPSLINLNEELGHKHLKKCFENLKIEPFPPSAEPNPKRQENEYMPLGGMSLGGISLGGIPNGRMPLGGLNLSSTCILK